jgi:hypothetical protein
VEALTPELDGLFYLYTKDIKQITNWMFNCHNLLNKHNTLPSCDSVNYDRYINDDLLRKNGFLRAILHW